MDAAAYNDWRLALLSPLGLILPRIMNAGAAWGEWGVDEIKNVPKSVRDNPGSYRSSYGWGRTYSGGK